jgi:hypothetical protein
MVIKIRSAFDFGEGKDPLEKGIREFSGIKKMFFALMKM